MPSRPFWQSTDTRDRASALLFSKQADDDIWSLGFEHNAQQDIQGLSDSLKLADPLPVVVSDRPDALKIQQQQQDRQQQASSAVAMPSASDYGSRTSTPASAGGSSGTPSAMPSTGGGGGGSTDYAPQGAGGDPSAGVEQWNDKIQAASRKYNVPVSVIKGIMHIESGGNPQAVSAAGAQSLMQVMPFHFGAGENGMDPDTNIDRGTKILADNYARYGDWDRAAAAYFGAIDANGNITDATDATGTNGSNYVRLFRDAASRYAGTPNAGATSPAPAASSSAPAAAMPSPSSPSAGDQGEMIIRNKVDGSLFRIKPSQWGPQFVPADWDIVSGPDMQKTAADVPDTGMSAGDQKRAKLAVADTSPTPAGVSPTPADTSPTLYRQPLMATPGADTNGADASLPFDPREQDAGPREAAPPDLSQTAPASYGSSQDEPGQSGTTLPQVDPASGTVSTAPSRLAAGGLSSVAAGVPSNAPAVYGSSQDDPGQPPSASPYTVVPSDAPLASDAGQTVEVPVTPSPGSRYQFLTADTPLPSDASAMTEVPVARPGADQAAVYGGGADDPGTAQSPPRIVQAGVPSISVPDLTPVYDAAGRLISYVQHGAQAIGQQISQNVQANQQAVTDANAASGTDGIDWGQGAAQALSQWEPGGMAESRAIHRLGEINAQAAADQGIAPTDVRSALTFGAADDPTWRAQNPELAAEYDGLQQQVTMSVGGMVGGGGEAPRPKPTGGGQPTVEVLQQRLAQADSIVKRLLGSGDAERLTMAQENRAALESQLIDAQNARRSLEPRIRSDVGQRIEDTVPTESSVERATDARFPTEGAPTNPADLSGPVGVPTDVGSRLNVAAGPSAGTRLVNDAGNAIRGAMTGGVTAAVTDPGSPQGEDESDADYAIRRARERAQRIGTGALIGAGGFVAGGRLLPRGPGGALQMVGPNREPRYVPELAQEPVLPGFEPPRVKISPPTSSGAVQALTEMRSTGSAALPTLEEHPGIMRRVADAVSPWANRVNITRYAGMLSDSATHIMNAAGNAILQAGDVAATPIAAGIDVMRSAVTGQSRQVFFSELPARLAGMRAGASTGLQAAWNVLRTGMSAEEAAKLDQAPKGFNSGSGAVDFAFEAPLRALAASDAVFRSIAAGGHMAAEATAAAMKANGGRAVTPEMIREAMKNPDLVERVNKLAARSVLQEDRGLTTLYQRLLRGADPVTRAAVSVEVPFVKTPYNVVAQGMGMTPAGLVGVIQDVAEGKAARDIEQRIARVALGTAVMAGAAADYGAGNLTGPYPTDQKEASTLPPGWKPWSRKVTVGGETYYLPLAVLGPFAVPAVTAILAGESIKRGKSALSPEWAGAVALGIGQYAEQQTFFQGLTNIAKTLENPDKQIQRNVEQVAAQFSPHVVGGGALGREIQRIMGMPARDPEGAIEALMATHPALANRVEPAQDVLGRPRSLGMSGPLGAIARASQDNDTAVIRAFRTAKEGLPMAAPKQIKDPNQDRMRTLTPAQQHRWRRVFGAALREEWVNQGNPRDVESLRSVESTARSVANESILGMR